MSAIANNPRCVNPSHLFLGTARDNSIDMVKKRRSSHGEFNSQHRLNSRQVSVVRRAADFSVRNNVLAEIFDVNPSTISLIKNRKNWRHA